MTFEDELGRQVDAAAARQILKPRRLPHVPHGFVPTAVTASVVTAALALAVLVVANRPDDAERPAAAPATTHGVTPALARSLAVLDRGVTASDALPAMWKRQIESNDAAPGALLDQARRVAAGRKDSSTWVIPAGSKVCLAQAENGAFSVNCSDLAEIRDGALATGTGSALGTAPDQVRVLGLLPDGVRDVAVLTADGNRQPVAVTENVYDALAPKQGAQLTWSDASGKPHVEPIRSAF
jgi:hypothetical protein